MTWIKDQEGDLWNSSGILWMFIDRFTNDRGEVKYVIKVRNVHKDVFDFRGPFDTMSEAKENLDMIYVDITTVNHE